MDVLLADADAVVFDADDDALFLALCRNADEGGRAECRGLSAEGRKCRLPTADCQLFPFFLKGVYGVADEVEDYLLHFIEVASDGQFFGARMESELY